jgi:hypothetical protein
MVKLDGPCMSMGARGTLGKTLTFAKTGKTAYAKKHFIPANPKTPGQTGVRMMVTFLTQIWSTLTDADKSSWTPFAEMFGLSLYHAFLKENCRRWASDLLPIKNTTYQYDGTIYDQSAEHEYNGTNWIIGLYITQAPFESPWIAQFCVGESADFVPNKSNTIGFSTEFDKYGADYTTFFEYKAPWTPTPYFKCRFAMKKGSTFPFVLSTYG